MKKNPFTILEVLIALTLMTFLGGLLLSSLRQVQAHRKELQATANRILQQERLYLRLIPIFHRLSSYKLSQKNLALFYNNGVILDKNFRGTVCSLLSLDQHCLILTTWGKDDRMFQEVLLESVEKISYFFFDPEQAVFTENIPKRPSPMLKIAIVPIHQPPFEIPVFL